jgi:putative oxidoreductase
MGVLPPDLIVDARTAVRIVCGLFFLPHTIAKLRNIERASLFFDKAGLRPSRFLVVLTTVLEVVAAFGLISGLYPRLGATIAAGILLVAAIAIARVHALNWRCSIPALNICCSGRLFACARDFCPKSRNRSARSQRTTQAPPGCIHCWSIMASP